MQVTVYSRILTVPNSIQDVGRSISTGSTASSAYGAGPIDETGASGVGRNPSIVTTVSDSSLTLSTNIVRASSSAATSVNRGNSFGSYVSKGSDLYLQAGHSQQQQQFSSQTHLQPQTQGQVSRSSSVQGPASSWRDNEIVRTLQDIKRPLELHGDWQDDDDDDFYDDDASEDDETRFFNPSLLSHIAVRLRDKVPRGTHVKGSIPYPRAFTGKDIVVSTTLSVLSAESHSARSRPFSRKSSVNSWLPMAYRQTTDGQRYRSLAVCRVSSFSTKWSGVAVRCRMVLRTSTCSLTIKRARRTPALSAKSCQRR